MGSDSPSLVAGWYGKIPALGDFASRRLPQPFIDAWDAWLQRSITASSTTLGERWTEVFLTSPMWRFVLMPGVCGESAWAGVMMPSVDKVGRHFPLTIAAQIDAHTGLPECVLVADDWYAEIERIALLALKLDFSADDLERELAEHPFPYSAGSPHDGADVEALARWWTSADPPPQCFGFAEMAGVTNALTAAFRDAVSAVGKGKSLWWSAPPVAAPAVLHCLGGLPPDDYFSLLLTGSKPDIDEGSATRADDASLSSILNGS